MNKRFQPPRSIYLSLDGRWTPVPEVDLGEPPPGAGRVVNVKAIDALAQRGRERNMDGKREPFVLLAGRVYEVDAAEAERLTACGYGEYLIDLPAPPEPPSEVVSWPKPASSTEVEELRQRIAALEAAANSKSPRKSA